ncbi:MAG: Esterase EstB, partial [Actinomycetota bacterium]
MHSARLLATLDDGRRELANGWVAVTNGFVSGIGSGTPPPARDSIDASGCLVTPGLVNVHHHLYQNLTRAYGPMTNSALFGWLRTLYPLWSALNEESAHVSAWVGLAELALSGCTTSTDHLYLHPRGGGDLLSAEIAAAVDLGMRFHPTRGSMSLSQKDGGLPPDDVVQEGLSQSKMPGCVVVVGRREGVVLRRAWGFRQTQPEQVAMTVDTVFDLASLTKPIAAATSVMILSERGMLDVNQKVAEYWPEFARNGKETITIRHLLTHTGGLIADNALSDYSGNPAESLQKIAELSPVAEPGAEFIYSDVGFIVLGHLVERVSGKNVNDFARAAIFEPLAMQETGYLPNEALRLRAAVTEQREDRWMRGEVHDPRAWRLGGIAGHAGLFSTA